MNWGIGPGIDRGMGSMGWIVVGPISKIAGAGASAGSKVMIGMIAGASAGSTAGITLIMAGGAMVGMIGIRW